MSCKILGAVLSVYGGVAFAGTAVITTGQYNNYRTGATNDSILTVSSVNVNTFGKVGSYAVDGAVFAQPLYLSNMKLGAGTAVDVLYVATMHNTIYAFNADKPGSAPLWSVNLAPSVPTGLAGACPHSNTSPELGILSTPVIDTGSGTLYAVYATPNSSNTYTHYIAALDITNGKQRTGSPHEITATVAGNGYDNVRGQVSLSQTRQIQRTALTLAAGSVYAGFSSCGPDPDPYHGWVLGYSAANVSVQTSVYNSTPNGQEGGIWQSGRGFVVDDLGNIYASTGNGTNSATDSSDSVVKFALGKPIGVFTDAHATALAQDDLDLGSSGPLYIESHNLLLAGGKEGIMHVLNPALIGLPGALLQNFNATVPCDPLVHDGCYQIRSIAFWDSPTNPLLYVWGSFDVLRAFRLSGNSFNTTPDSEGSVTTPYWAGAALALSVNSNNSAILWAVTVDGVLHAYQAVNVAQEIYNTSQNSTRDSLGDATHFSVPTIADGKVFVPTGDSQIQVYGMLQ
jgi:hypothetical protein